MRSSWSSGTHLVHEAVDAEVGSNGKRGRLRRAIRSSRWFDQPGAGKVPQGDPGFVWRQRAQLGDRFAVDGHDQTFTVAGPANDGSDLVPEFSYTDAVDHADEGSHRM